jgi:hypothetical protein
MQQLDETNVLLLHSEKLYSNQYYKRWTAHKQIDMSTGVDKLLRKDICFADKTV